MLRNFLSFSSSPPPKRKHSTADFEALHHDFKNIISDPHVKAKYNQIQYLISLTETYVLHSDSEDTSIFFDYFCEMKFLSIYSSLLALQSKEISLLILNSVSLLLQNLHNKQHLYYFYSSSIITELIALSFNDENFLAYQMSFIKSLALKLDNSNDIVYFFFDKKKMKFPLISKSISFANNSDDMLRAHVRNIMLHILKINNVHIRTFILTFPTCIYFIYVLTCIKNMIMQLVVFEFGNNVNKRYIMLSEELLELIEYVNDLLSIHVDELNQLIVNGLLCEIVFPLCKVIVSPKQEKVSPMFALYVITMMYLVVKNEESFTKVVEDLFINENIVEWMYKEYIECNGNDFDYVEKDFVNEIEEILHDSGSINESDKKYENVINYIRKLTSQNAPYSLYRKYTTGNNDILIHNELHKTFVLFFTSKDDLLIILLNLLIHFIIQRNITSIDFFQKAFFNISSPSNKLLPLLFPPLHSSSKFITLTPHLILSNLSLLILHCSSTSSLLPSLTSSLTHITSLLTHTLKHCSHTPLLRETAYDLTLKSFDIYTQDITCILSEPTNLPYLSIPCIYADNTTPRYLHYNKYDTDYFVANCLTCMALYDCVLLLMGKEREMIRKGNFDIGIESSCYEIGDILNIHEDIGANFFSCSLYVDNVKRKAKVIIENEEVYIAVRKNKKEEYVIQYAIPLRRVRVHIEGSGSVIAVKDAMCKEKEYGIDVKHKDKAVKIKDIINTAKENAIELSIGIVLSLIEGIESVV